MPERKFGHSTYCNDPKATHKVETASQEFGYGIYGYFTSEFEARHVARKTGGVWSTYDPNEETKAGIHPLIAAHLGIEQ